MSFGVKSTKFVRANMRKCDFFILISTWSLKAGQFGEEELFSLQRPMATLLYTICAVGHYGFKQIIPS